jgi:hypothetical protein
MLLEKPAFRTNENGPSAAIVLAGAIDSRFGTIKSHQRELLAFVEVASLPEMPLVKGLASRRGLRYGECNAGRRDGGQRNAKLMDGRAFLSARRHKGY